MSPYDTPAGSEPATSTLTLASAMRDLADAAPSEFPHDPERLGLANRIAAPSDIKGELAVRGGLLLQGKLGGSGEIHGPLVLWHGAQLCGHFRVMGDVYLFGTLGDESDPRDTATTVECHGTVYLARSAMSCGTLFAARLMMSEGATLVGPFRTLPGGSSLPVLRPVG